MTDKKWTPGPWGLISDTDDDWGLWTVHNAKNPLDHVCDVADHPNAHLIAAAPDLYDALEYVYENGDGEHSRAMMKYALAKARGET